MKKVECEVNPLRDTTRVQKDILISYKIRMRQNTLARKPAEKQAFK